MRAEFPLLNDRGWLVRIYHEEKQSILDIAKMIGCHHLRVHRAFRMHGIPKRTQSEARRLVQHKTDATCLERYGAVNPLSKGTEPERRRNATVKERYGVTNVFQHADIKTTNIARMKAGGVSNAKRLNTMKQRYGILTPFARPDVRAKIARSFLGGAKGRYISSLNRRAYEVLQRHSVEFEPEYLIGALSYDLRVGDMLVELNGDHPHANPVRFAADDVVVLPGQRYTAANVWARDARKAELARVKGFRLVTLWESDLKTDFEATLLEAINVIRD